MTRSAGMAGAFDDLADRYDHSHHGHVARALIEQVGPGPDDAIADAACGAGAVTLQLAQRRRAGARPVLAVDLSPGMVAVGRARAERLGCAEAIDWRVADAVPLPVEDRSLDVVFCASSLHFLGRRALTDWRRALRPGGRMGFTLPLGANRRPTGTFARLVAEDVPMPETAEEAGSWVEACGYAQVEARIQVLGARQVVVVSASAPV